MADTFGESPFARGVTDGRAGKPLAVMPERWTHRAKTMYANGHAQGRGYWLDARIVDLIAASRDVLSIPGACVDLQRAGKLEPLKAALSAFEGEG